MASISNRKAFKVNALKTLSRCVDKVSEEINSIEPYIHIVKIRGTYRIDCYPHNISDRTLAGAIAKLAKKLFTK